MSTRDEARTATKDVTSTKRQTALQPLVRQERGTATKPTTATKHEKPDACRRRDNPGVANRSGIDALLYLMDEAFRGPGIEETDESQALLPNLATVDESAWRALPSGAARSIESIALHVGTCKVMYDDYAFGDGTLDWDQPAVQPWPEGAAPMDDVTRWLETVHQRLVDHVASLASDDELDAPRLTNWGELQPTRWIVAVMITHDAYHAGEINHLRSVLGPDDRWRHVQEGF
jgi:uncharacterized damage-inducible protein DinB